MRSFAMPFAAFAISLSIVAMLDARAREAQAKSLQQTQTKPASSRAYPQPAPSAKKIGFRAPVWKTLHLHDQQEAHTTAEVLKKIGCQVALNQHNGHTDVRFLCQAWKTLPAESDTEIAKWQTWLSNKGLETVVVNPAPSMNMSTVRFRLTNMQTAHLHDAAHAKSITELYQMLGCDVSTREHNGHTDLTVRCPNWITIGLSNCQQAHQWQTFFKQNGFATEHKH